MFAKNIKNQIIMKNFMIDYLDGNDTIYDYFDTIDEAIKRFNSLKDDTSDMRLSKHIGQGNYDVIKLWLPIYYDIHVQLDEKHGYSVFVKVNDYKNDNELIKLCIDNDLIDYEDADYVDNITECDSYDFESGEGIDLIDVMNTITINVPIQMDLLTGNFDEVYCVLDEINKSIQLLENSPQVLTSGIDKSDII